MKILTVGDIHGREYWQTINTVLYDKIIFVGDYLDSFNINNDDMFSNFAGIIQFKKDYPDKVELLLGNHDLYYWFNGDDKFRCSGNRPVMVWDIHDLMRINHRLFQAAYQYDKYIWTHAGIHMGWYRLFIKDQIDPDDVDLADTLNRLFEMNYDPLFRCSYYRGGPAKEGGIFWADKKETWDKPLPGYHQIVGHSPTDIIHTRTRPYKNKIFGKVTYVDCLHTGPNFYELDIKEENPMMNIREMIKKYESSSLDGPDRVFKIAFENFVKELKNIADPDESQV